MDQYLDKFLEIIPESQRQKLLDALQLDVIAEHNPSLLELAQRLLYEKTTEYQPQPEHLDSIEYNKLTASIYADLHVLFNQAEVLDVLIYNNHLLNLAEIEEMQRELNRIRLKIHALRDEIISTEATIVRTEDFTTLMRLEPYTDETRYLYTDKDGRVVGEHEVAHINTLQGICKLPELSDKFDVLQRGVARRLPELSNTEPNIAHPVNKVNDGLYNTFWGEFLVSQSRVTGLPGSIDIPVIAPEEPEIIIDKPGDRACIVLNIDVSHSMATVFKSHVQDIALRIVDRIEERRPNDLIALMSFNEQVRLHCNFTADREKIRNLIRNDLPEPQGPTALAQSYFDAMTLLSKQYGDRVIITISDLVNTRPPDVGRIPGTWHLGDRAYDLNVQSLVFCLAPWFQNRVYYHPDALRQFGMMFQLPSPQYRREHDTSRRSQFQWFDYLGGHTFFWMVDHPVEWYKWHESATWKHLVASDPSNPTPRPPYTFIKYDIERIHSPYPSHLAPDGQHYTGGEPVRWALWEPNQLDVFHPDWGFPKANPFPQTATIQMDIDILVAAIGRDLSYHRLYRKGMTYEDLGWELPE